MNLSEDQLNKIFKYYIDKYILPGSIGYLDYFKQLDNGHILTRRLKKILRNKKYDYIVHGDKIDGEELLRVARELLQEKRILIIGLNYWFSSRDLDLLLQIHNKFFVK